MRKITKYTILNGKEIIILSDSERKLIKLKIETVDHENDGAACNIFCKLHSHCSRIKVDNNGTSLQQICHKITRINGYDFYINESCEEVTLLLKGKVVKRKNRGI